MCGLFGLILGLPFRYNISQDDRLFIKENAMKLMSEGTLVIIFVVFAIFPFVSSEIVLSNFDARRMWSAPPFVLQDILSEEAHIKDGVSRIVVEMMKREWPQHWPTLMEELSTLSQAGATQTELVLLVLLRLAEDVMTFRYSCFPDKSNACLRVECLNVGEFNTGRLKMHRKIHFCLLGNSSSLKFRNL